MVARPYRFAILMFVIAVAALFVSAFASPALCDEVTVAESKLLLPQFEPARRIKVGEFLNIPPSSNSPNADNTRTITQEITFTGQAIVNPSGAVTTPEDFRLHYIYPSGSTTWNAALPAITAISLTVIRLNDFTIVETLQMVAIATPPEGSPAGSSAFMAPKDIPLVWALADNAQAVYKFQLTFTFAPRPTVNPTILPQTDFPTFYFQQIDQSPKPVYYRWVNITPPTFTTPISVDRFGNAIDLDEAYHINLRPDTTLATANWLFWHWGFIQSKHSLPHTMFAALDITFPIADWLSTAVPYPDRVQGLIISTRGLSWLESTVTRATCWVNGRSVQFTQPKFVNDENEARREVLRWVFDEAFIKEMTTKSLNSVRIMCPTSAAAVLFPTNVAHKAEAIQYIIEPFQIGPDPKVDTPLYHRGTHFVSYSHPERPTSREDVLDAPLLTTLPFAPEWMFNAMAPPSITRVWDASTDDVVRISAQFLVEYPPLGTTQYNDSTVDEFLDHIIPSVNAIQHDDKDAMVYGVVSGVTLGVNEVREGPMDSYTFSTPITQLKPFLFSTVNFHTVPDSHEKKRPSSWGYHVSVVATGKLNPAALLNTTKEPIGVEINHFASSYNPNPKKWYATTQPQRPMTPPTVGFGAGSMDLAKVLQNSQKGGSGWELDLHSTKVLQFRMKWTPTPDILYRDTEISTIIASVPGWGFKIDFAEFVRMPSTHAWLKVFNADGAVVLSQTMSTGSSQTTGPGYIKLSDSVVQGSIIQVDMPWISLRRPTKLDHEAKAATPMNEIDFSAVPVDEPAPKVSAFPVHLSVSVGNKFNPVSIAYDNHQKSLPLTSRGQKNGVLGWKGSSGGSTAWKYVIIFIIIVIVAAVIFGGLGIFFALRKKSSPLDSQNAQYRQLS